jgi:hypothetical protein
MTVLLVWRMYILIGETLMNESRLTTRFWLTALSATLGLCVLYPYLLDKGLDAAGLMWRIDRRAQFGESFGALTSLLSGLACILITWALYLQRQELRAQQMHLKYANQVLEEQVNADRDQSYLQGLAALSRFHQKRAEMLERKGDSHGSEREWDEAMRHKHLLAEKIEKLSMKHRL